MLIKSSESQKKENSKSCSVREYDLPIENCSFAIIKINWRYPNKWKVSNLECDEIYYVISGSWIIYSDKWDLYHFEKTEVYWVEADNLELSVVNTPKWTAKQHILVD